MNDFLWEVFKEFRHSVETGLAICSLKKMIYLTRPGMVDFDDLRLRMLYVLRYGFAVGWEYYQQIMAVKHDRNSDDPMQVYLAGDSYGILEAVEKELPDDVDLRINEVSVDKADLYLIPCALSELQHISLKGAKYLAVASHNSFAMKEAKLMLRGASSVYNASSESRKIPWDYPEEIHSYLRSLNERCVNYKNGHNCFGVCARQLDLEPVLESGSIQAGVYKNSN